MEDKPTFEVATKLDGSHAAFTVFTSTLQTAGTVLGTRCNPAQTERIRLRLSAFEMNFVRGLVSVWQKCLRLETSWWKLRKGSYLFIYFVVCVSNKRILTAFSLLSSLFSWSVCSDFCQILTVDPKVLWFVSYFVQLMSLIMCTMIFWQLLYLYVSYFGLVVHKTTLITYLFCFCFKCCLMK